MVPGLFICVRFRTFLPLGAAVLLALQLPSGCHAQGERPVQIAPRSKPADGATTAGSQPLLQVDSSLVLIPVHVTTASGASVTDLKKENFAVFEDGIEQPITQFAIDEAPVSVGILLDASGSMKNKVRKVGAAAKTFLRSANPGDEYFLIEFNERAKLRVPFTRDWEPIESAIARVRPFGLTSLLDALHLALRQMTQARNVRKAILILSDGGDNFSRRNLRQMKDSLMEARIQVYSLGIFDGDYSVKHTPEERRGPQLLEQVALETGGRSFPVLNVEELNDIGTRMARDLRDQYVLGYAPASSMRDGKYHRLAVQLRPPNDTDDLRAFYRQGYYALQ